MSDSRSITPIPNSSSANTTTTTTTTTATTATQSTTTLRTPAHDSNTPSFSLSTDRDSDPAAPSSSSVQSTTRTLTQDQTMARRLTDRSPPTRGRPPPQSSPSSDSQDELMDTEMEDKSSHPSQAAVLPIQPKKKRTRTLTTPHQSAVLYALLAQSRFPSTAVREEVGKSIGLSARKVQIWFQNQRQKARRPKNQVEAGRKLHNQHHQHDDPLSGGPPSSSSRHGPYRFPEPGSSSEMTESPVGTAFDRVAGASQRGYHSDSPAQLSGPGMPGSDSQVSLRYSASATTTTTTTTTGRPSTLPLISENPISRPSSSSPFIASSSSSAHQHQHYHQHHRHHPHPHPHQHQHHHHQHPGFSRSPSLESTADSRPTTANRSLHDHYYLSRTLPPLIAPPTQPPPPHHHHHHHHHHRHHHHHHQPISTAPSSYSSDPPRRTLPADLRYPSPEAHIFAHLPLDADPLLPLPLPLPVRASGLVAAAPQYGQHLPRPRQASAALPASALGPVTPYPRVPIDHHPHLSQSSRVTLTYSPLHALSIPVHVSSSSASPSSPPSSSGATTRYTRLQERTTTPPVSATGAGAGDVVVGGDVAVAVDTAEPQLPARVGRYDPVRGIFVVTTPPRPRSPTATTTTTSPSHPFGPDDVVNESD